MGVVVDRQAYRPVAGAKAWAKALDDGAATFQTLGWYTPSVTFGFADRVMDEHICNFITDGSMRAEVDGQTHLLLPGSILWVAPGVPHSFSLGEPGQVFTMINTRWRLRRQGRDHAFPEGLLIGHDRWDLRALFDMLYEGRRRADAGERARRIWYLLYSDLVTADEPGDGALDRRRQQALITYVHRHAGRAVTPADLAQVVGLSPDYFRRIFHRTFGRSPRSWIARERIRLAAQRLIDEPGSSITAVAASYGYDDLSLFSRRFKAVMGIGPRAWRRR